MTMIPTKIAPDETLSPCEMMFMTRSSTRSTPTGFLMTRGIADTMPMYRAIEMMTGLKLSASKNMFTCYNYNNLIVRFAFIYASLRAHVLYRHIAFAYRKTFARSASSSSPSRA